MSENQKKPVHGCPHGAIGVGVRECVICERGRLRVALDGAQEERDRLRARNSVVEGVLHDTETRLVGMTKERDDAKALAAANERQRGEVAAYAREQERKLGELLDERTVERDDAVRRAEFERGVSDKRLVQIVAQEDTPVVETLNDRAQKVEFRYVAVRGARYLRVEDVAEFIREIAATEATDVRNRLNGAAENLIRSSVGRTKTTP